MDWTVKEFAKMAGLKSSSRIRQKISAGELNTVKRAGAHFVIDDEKSRRYLSLRKDGKRK